jgi:hypothetical protein
MQRMGKPVPMPPEAAAVSEEAGLRSLWQQAGLRSVETRSITIETSYADLDDFWDSNCGPVGPHGQAIAAMSPADQARLRESLGALLPVGRDGRISVPARANAVRGTLA